MNTFKFALSHSRLSDFNQCPLKFKLKYVDKAGNFKMDATKSPHLVRGTNVHAALEKYIVKTNAGEQGIRASSLPEVENTKPFIDKLFQDYSIVNPELQLSVDINWSQVDWFAKDSYYRVIFDVLALNKDNVFVGDFKTGKFTDYTPNNGYGQLELSSAIALSVWPEAEKVSNSYIYVDHRKIVMKTYTQADKTRLVDHFIKEHDKVNSEEDFDPKVNEYCKWCEATKDQCSYSRKSVISSKIELPSS